MNKKLILLAFYINFIVVVVESAKLKPYCNYHAAFYKTRIILTRILYTDANGKKLNDALQKQFLNSKPSEKSEEDLGVCSQYAGQNSCCDINMAKLIDQAALLKVKPLQQAKSAFQKLIHTYIKQIQKNCPSSEISSPDLTAEVILSNADLKILQQNKETQAVCKVNFAKAISSYTRGTLCSICIGVENLKDYFDDSNKLKISQESVDKFQKETEDNINCHKQIFDQANIEKIIQELNSVYIKNSNKCGDTVVKNIQSIFAHHRVSNNDGKDGKLCKGTLVYGDNSACERVLQGDSSLDNKSDRFLNFEDEYLNRILQQINDAVVDKDGTNIYTISKTDDQIDESGNQIVPNFEGIDANSQKNLIASIFICIFFLLI
ncbi:hypothetical protein ABPG74_000382 [Tetrahymena malaccensis]